ncbi:MAG: N-formylglutamate amidohydrolase [Paracoccaceae bacterium]
MVEVICPTGASPVVLVCEHASSHIPAELDELGLSPEARSSHAAWDPGALGVAKDLSEELDAVLVASRVSRLAYDCNRPPEAIDAMPVKSEVYDVPGNVDLGPDQRQVRVAQYYDPFHAVLSAEIAKRPDAVIVTIHSFTPVYNGQQRSVEIGILHDQDTRLADALLDIAGSDVVLRNEPYGPAHGVTHTLKRHALPGGLLNVMIEIRNDLIQTAEDQKAIAKDLAGWLGAALSENEVPECKA